MWAYCFKHKHISVTCHAPDEDYDLDCGCKIRARDIEKHRVRRVFMVGNYLLVKKTYQPKYDLVKVSENDDAEEE